jgi:hypothetical protein
MGGTPVSDRQVRLLAVVAEGGGDWDARRIDITVDTRSGPGEETVLQELEALQRLGLVVRRQPIGRRRKMVGDRRRSAVHPVASRLRPARETQLQGEDQIPSRGTTGGSDTTGRCSPQRKCPLETVGSQAERLPISHGVHLSINGTEAGKRYLVKG